MADYMELITKIESFEQDCYKQFKSNTKSSNPIDSFNKEIHLLENELTTNRNLNMNEILESINNLKNKIGKLIFK